MTRKFDLNAAIWAGLIAGLVFMMLEMLLVHFFEPMSMWAPPRMIAAMALGRDVLPPPDTFNITIFIVAMMIHFPLSMVYAITLGWVVSRSDMSLSAAILAGTVFGLAIYVVNAYGFTVLFPWFANARGWIAIVSHAMFGFVLGGVYASMMRQTRTRNHGLAGVAPRRSEP